MTGDELRDTIQRRENPTGSKIERKQDREGCEMIGTISKTKEEISQDDLARLMQVPTSVRHGREIQRHYEILTNPSRSAAEKLRSCNELHRLLHRAERPTGATEQETKRYEEWHLKGAKTDLMAKMKAEAERLQEMVEDAAKTLAQKDQDQEEEHDGICSVCRKNPIYQDRGVNTACRNCQIDQAVSEYNQSAEDQRA